MIHTLKEFDPLEAVNAPQPFSFQRQWELLGIAQMMLSTKLKAACNVFFWDQTQKAAQGPTHSAGLFVNTQ